VLGQGLDGVPEPYRSQARSLDLGSPRPTPAPAEPPLSPPPPLAPTVPLTSPPPARWEPSGALPQITRVSFPRGSHILVEAKINGQGPVKLLLDTGSHQTHVSAQAVRTLGISAPSYPCRSCEIEIIGGTKVVRHVQILSLRVGDAEMTGPAFMDDTDFYDRLGAIGVLGRNYLDNFRVTIDSRQQVVTLVPTAISGLGTHDPSFAAANVTRISFPPHPYILVSSAINGRGPITLILDTGAPGTRLSAKALRSLGISPKNDLTCPQCSARLTRLVDPQGIEVNWCKSCPGTWHDKGVLDATRLLSKRGIRRLPVVSKTGQLVGILSLDDLLMLLGSELSHVASMLASELGRPRV